MLIVQFFIHLKIMGTRLLVRKCCTIYFLVQWLLPQSSETFLLKCGLSCRELRGSKNADCLQVPQGQVGKYCSSISTQAAEACRQTLRL